MENPLHIEQCQLFDAVTCKEDDDLQTAVQLLKKHTLRHLYVVDNSGKLLGVFAGIDVLYNVIAEGKACTNVHVKDIMKTDVISFPKTDSVLRAIGFMSKTNIMSCPVVVDEKLVGVLSYGSAVKAIAAQRSGEKK